VSLGGELTSFKEVLGLDLSSFGDDNDGNA
jgi:hypothetical protein